MSIRSVMLLGAWAAVLLAGCATPGRSGPSPATALLPPASWAHAQTQAPATDLRAWWRRFGDPQLSALVDAALARNPSLAQARASLAQARAQVDLARAGSAVTLGAGGSAGASRSGQAGTVQTWRAGLDAAWEADLFGTQAAGVRAAQYGATAAQATLADAQVSLAAEVGLAYIGLRGNQQRLAVALANQASQQQTQTITAWRQRAGLTSTLELQQANTAVAQTQAQLPALQAAIAQGAHALAVLTGQPPAALLQDLDPTRPLPALPADLALALPADTLRQRPDVRAAEAQALAALANVQVAEGGLKPSLRLSGSLGLSALRLSDLLDTAALARSLLASVNWPLLDGGAAQASVAARQAGLDAARAAWQASVLGALKDVEDALVQLREDRQREAHLRAAAAAAAAAEALARQRLDAGLVDFQVVLETQRTLLAAQNNLAAAATDIATDHVRLYKALGGGWTPEPEATP